MGQEYKNNTSGKFSLILTEHAQYANTISKITNMLGMSMFVSFFAFNEPIRFLVEVNNYYAKKKAIAFSVSFFRWAKR